MRTPFHEMYQNVHCVLKYLEPLPRRQEKIDEYSSLDEATRCARLVNELNEKTKDRIIGRTRHEVLTNVHFFFILMSEIHVQVIQWPPLDYRVRRTWILSAGVMFVVTRRKSMGSVHLRMLSRLFCNVRRRAE